MRTNRVIIGAVILIIAMTSYFYVSDQMEDIEQYGALGDVAMELDEDLQSSYNMYKFISYASIIGMVIGGIIILIGLAGGS